MDEISCRRCGRAAAPALEKAPFRSELGERIQSEICRDCWKDWLQHQTLLINHYGLDPRDAEARSFLYGQIESVLFGEGDEAEVDTTKKGQVEW